MEIITFLALNSYDFVVVGGGTTGSTVAGRLAELDATVLVIEAGPEEPPICQIPSLYGNLPNTELDWQFKTEPQKLACLNNENQSCDWPRGKVCIEIIKNILEINKYI